jgi:hypothetical protein
MSHSEFTDLFELFLIASPCMYDPVALSNSPTAWFTGLFEPVAITSPCMYDPVKGREGISNHLTLN